MFLNIKPQTIEIIEQVATQHGCSVENFIIMSAYEKALHSLASRDDLFDIERMQQAIGETDENGRAVHTIEVPSSALTDLEAFKKWLKTA